MSKLSLKTRQRISETNKRVWADSKLRLRMSKIKKAQYKDSGLRKKMDRAITLWWKEHPNIKKKYALRAEKEFAENPKSFEKFIKAGKNPLSLRLKTKFGFKVRSKGEKEIADYLFGKKIKAFYESKVLSLDSWLCVPDFFIPKYKTYIEYYGGYPGSWKKKVLKNKLYKKHKIPVIAITPSELRDLDSALGNRFK